MKVQSEKAVTACGCVVSHIVHFKPCIWERIGLLFGMNVVLSVALHCREDPHVDGAYVSARVGDSPIEQRMYSGRLRRGADYEVWRDPQIEEVESG